MTVERRASVGLFSILDDNGQALAVSGRLYSTQAARSPLPLATASPAGCHDNTRRIQLVGILQWSDNVSPVGVVGAFPLGKNRQHYKNRQEDSTADENGNNAYPGLPILALPNTHLVLQGSKKLTVG